jgi:CRP-like cAMP-binding protein
VLRVANGS